MILRRQATWKSWEGKCHLNYHNLHVDELSDHFHLDIAVLDKAIRLVAIFVFSSLVT